MALTKSHVDEIVGENIKRLRIKSGLSQTAVGDALGVTFQQVQKYETGRNRITAGKLNKLAMLLDVSMSELFEGADNPDRRRQDDPVSTEAFKLAADFDSISDPVVRKQLRSLVASLSGQEAAVAAA